MAGSVGQLLVALVMTRFLVETEIKGNEQKEGTLARPQVNIAKGERAVARTRFDLQTTPDKRTIDRR